MGSEEEIPTKSKFMTALPLLLLLVSIPLSLTLWLGNMAFSAFWESDSGKCMHSNYNSYLNENLAKTICWVL